MLKEMKRRFRRWVAGEGRRGGARIPEGPQPGGPERPDEAADVRPPENPKRDEDEKRETKEKMHDGWSEIRPRRPGEDTDMGRDMMPDVTYPGRDLRPPREDEKR